MGRVLCHGDSTVSWGEYCALKNQTFYSGSPWVSFAYLPCYSILTYFVNNYPMIPLFRSFAKSAYTSILRLSSCTKDHFLLVLQMRWREEGPVLKPCCPGLCNSCCFMWLAILLHEPQRFCECGMSERFSSVLSFFMRLL